jgi:hypothetical protein
MTRELVDRVIRQPGTRGAGITASVVCVNSLEPPFLQGAFLY